MAYLTATRRKLHAMAELSGAEKNTSAFIVSELKRFGYKPKTIGTGVYCDVGKGNNRLAFRADIDALPLIEDVAVTGMGDYAAQGAMHACGHDGHAANLLNVARIIGGKSDVPLRFIFQFDEEVDGGSTVMIDNGVLDGVSEVYALHLCPELDEGKIGYCYGAMFAGCCEFDIIYSGRAGHCSTTDGTADAIRSAVEVAQFAYGLADRLGLKVNLGKMNGGHARNIIADGCVQQYTLRFYDTSACESFMIEIERAALSADDGNGTDHSIKTTAVYPPLVNHAYAVDRVRSLMGDKCIAVPPKAAAEDFSNFLQNTVGCMVWLGVRSPAHTSPLHSPTFSFDERALVTGTELFVKLIRSYAK